MRLAWFSPLPPGRSGIAAYSADLLAELGQRHQIEAFVDAPGDAVRERTLPHAPLESRDVAAGSAGPVAIAGATRLSAHDFVWRQARAPYDLTVFHLADSAQHDFVWPYLFQWPGLTVLHDGRVHPSRSRALLTQHRHDDYRAEFAWNHPEVAPAAAELAVNGYEGPFSCQWPMIRTVLAASRLVATHARGALAELEATSAGRPLEYLAPGDGGSIARPGAGTDETAARVRTALGLPASAVVFGVFDPLGHEWRVPQILRAFGGVLARTADARLLLAGPRDPQVDVDGLAGALGLSDVTRVVDLASMDPGMTLDVAAAATDVTLALRWPAGLDTPGTWLRALAAGRATVILDLVHLADVPALDPRTWQRHAPRDASASADADAVTVGIDVMDEDHSLRLALQRLATDAPLRARLGQAARAYWEARHTPARMVDDYARAIARAAAMAVPEVALPAHLRPDPLAHARALVAPIGEPATSIVAALAGPRG
jgi:glycosyltransferase involved in cell wall biosynthesis